jgi:hypothetical protein
MCRFNSKLPIPKNALRLMSYLSVLGQEITVAIKTALPYNIPRARMFADPIFILERLRDSLKSPPQNFNDTLVHKLFSTDKQLQLGRVPLKISANLNEFQKSAVERSLGSEVFFIWGPPGTGKTTTISSIISHAFSDGKDILISSNTNVAVDNAISGVEKSHRENMQCRSIPLALMIVARTNSPCEANRTNTLHTCTHDA